MDLTKHLTKFDDKELAEIWCHFNSWDFSPLLEEYKPHNWHVLPREEKMKYVSPICSFINDKVPLKELLREWNKNRMTDSEFDEWWDGENRPTIERI